MSKAENPAQARGQSELIVGFRELQRYIWRDW